MPAAIQLVAATCGAMRDERRRAATDVNASRLRRKAVNLSLTYISRGKQRRKSAGNFFALYENDVRQDSTMTGPRALAIFVAAFALAASALIALPMDALEAPQEAVADPAA